MKVEIKLLLFTSNDTIVIKKVQVMRIKDFHCNIPVFLFLLLRKCFLYQILVHVTNRVKVLLLIFDHT